MLISYLFVFTIFICYASCFNILTEFFNDLRFGTLNHEYLKQKLDINKMKCLQGSYSFNGSCYFISNKKNLERLETDKDEIFLQNLMRFSKKQQNEIKNSQIGSMVELASVPQDATWIGAVNLCQHLNNDSNLFAFNNNLKEYEFIAELLYKINFHKEFLNQAQSIPTKLLDQEQKYFIGLTFNNSMWKWLTGLNLSDEMVDKFSLSKIKEDSYRKCSYLNLRDDGNVKIELTNCNNEKQPFICKYVIDRCYNNTNCGDYGECVNIPYKKTFECRCRIFYEGEKCEKWSNQGIQMIITVSLVIAAFLIVLIVKLASRLKTKLKKRKQKILEDEELNRKYFSSKGIDYDTLDPLILTKNQRYSVLTFETNIFQIIRKNLDFTLLIIFSIIVAFLVILTITLIRSKIIEARIKRFQSKFNLTQLEEIDKNSTSSRLTTFFNLDFCKITSDQFLEDYFIIYVSLSLTIFIYFWNAFMYKFTHEKLCKWKTKRSKPEHANNEESKESNSDTNDDLNSCNTILRFFLQIFESIGLRKCENIKIHRFKCSCDIEFPIPINPFSKHNRFITSVIYAAYTYNILKIFEYLLIGDQVQLIESNRRIIKNISKNVNFTNLHSVQNVHLSEINLENRIYENGILMELLKQICNVFIIGFRYYPVLLCVELKRKSKICYFLCTFYVLFLLIYYVYMNMFCLLSAYNTIKSAYETMDSSSTRTLIQYESLNTIGLKVKHVINSSTQLNETQNLQKANVKFDNTSKNNNFTNELQFVNSTLFINNFMYEKFIFYAVLILISFYMISEFAKLIIKSLKEKRKKKKCICCRKNMDMENNVDTSHENCINSSENNLIGKVDNDIKYTKELLKPNLHKPISFSKYLFEKYIYKSRRYFRYSSQFICTNIIAYVLLYYITCLIIRKSKLIVSVSSNLLILAINLIFKMNAYNDSGIMLISKNQLNKFVLALYDNISNYIIIASCFTTSVYAIQLFIGIKNYHKHVLNAYRGTYAGIPSPKRFSSAKMASSSLHYSGYSIGYMLWGYLILFEVTLVIIIVIRFLIKFHFIAENLAKIVLPILTIFLFKRIIIWYLCRYFLVNNRSNKIFFFKNRKMYSILNHFNFFFDCFLGSFVCFMRMAKSSVAALFFMPRLDYSIFGRYLERTDMGFISYVTFIHIEVNQTHPIKLAFCELLIKSMKDRPTTSKERKLAKNRWSLAYTLLNNSILKKQRKRCLILQKIIPRVESFEQFLERQVRIMFSKDDKKKSKSTPCLTEEPISNEEQLNLKIKTSTIDSKNPPKVAPRRNVKADQLNSMFFNNNFIALADNYYQNLDTTNSNDNINISNFK